MLVGSVVGLVQVASAGPDDSRSASKLSLRFDGDDHKGTFKGQVQNMMTECQRGRTVVVKHFRRGRPTEMVGTATTDRFGNWKLHDPEAHGRYWARVKESSFEKPEGGTHTCKADDSWAVKVRH
jgi:hypothetical protein